MRIVFFASETERYAGIRHRVVKFMERLQAEGHACVFCPPAPVSWWEALYGRRGRFGKALYLLLVLLRRLAQLRHASGADVVFVKGSVFLYGPPLLERIISLLNPRLVFDVDDAMWAPPAYVKSPFLRWVDFGWAAKMAKMARHAVAGNALIEAYLKEQGAVTVTVIPTCIDMERHPLKTYPQSPPGAPVTLGWMGTRDNLGYLHTLKGALQEIARCRPIRLLVVSDGHFECPGVAVENRSWTLAREVEDLAEMDIGLMPLEDTPRARGKCAFKALQYMAVGTPVVLSPVGMNREVVQDGVSGWLADTPGAWRERLAQLIEDPALRERMGRAARERVEKYYSYGVHYPRFLAVLQAVANGKDG